APADIDRIREPLAIVGAGVKQNWQGRRRVETGAGGVECQLADRDAHTASTLIAKPQYALTVADDNRLDPVEAGVAEDLLDAIAMRPAEKKPARIVPIVAELLAAFSDRRRIDQRQHLGEVSDQ